MALVELSMVIGAIVEIGVEAVWQKAKRHETVLKLLKRFKLDPIDPPTDFDGIYAYTLIEYGVFKPEPVLNFFRNEFVRDAFRLSFYKNDPSILDKEADDIIRWNEETGKLGQIDYNPRREFAAFSAVFYEIIDRTRTPAEVRRDQRLQDIYGDLHQRTGEILERLGSLDALDEIRAEFARLVQSYQARQFVVAPTGERLKVFISSKMMELRHVREFVAKALDQRGIDAWVYETRAGARPEGVVETSLREVEATDIYVGLFWQRFGEVTVQEYRHARAMDKPCFVYICDKDIRREKALEDFLRDEVYDLNQGVTYDYFDSAVELSKQVADDVMAWLVRRHREMTAEIQEAHASLDEIARLQTEVDRLQAASRECLPQGTAVDYLARQMRLWFETLGYGFENHDIRTEDYFEWIINVPARRGFDRILVRGVDSEAELGHIVSLRLAVDEQRTDEGWLVAVRRKSQAACEEVGRRENRDLFCYTFDELLEEHADFSGYLDWLEVEVKRRGIDRMYVPLACTKDEFDPISKEKTGVSQYDQRNGWIDGYIDRWLDDPAKEHISILGEFGTGKTWFALHYAWTAAQRYIQAKERGVKRPRLPLVIPLRDYAKAVTVESLFSEFFFRKHEIPLPGYSAFEQLNRMGKLLLIFDGFDEMAARVDRQKMINNFWELARVVVSGAKVVLTCRTEHFPEAREGRALLSAELQASTAKLTGEPPQFEVLELSKFDTEQIRQVLYFRADSITVEKVLDNRELLDLARRPVMIEYILDALPDIKAGKPVDLSRVYLYATRRKMERDIKAERTFTSMADKLYFLCELSWEMLSTDQMSLNYRLFPDRLRRLFGPTVQEQKDLDHWHYDMMGQTMLIRNADGDYTPAHRSLLEFFAAYKFAAEMGALAPDFTELAQAQAHLDESVAARNYTWSAYFQRATDETGKIVSTPPLREFTCEPLERLANTVGKQKLAEEVLRLMANMVVEEPLWAIVEATRDKTTETCAYSAGNAISLLSRLKKELRRTDFSSAKLRGADLKDVDLSGAIFRDADLRGAHFSGAYLKNTDFTGAKLEEISVSNPFLVGIPMSDAVPSWLPEPRPSLLQTIALSISRGEHIAIVGLRRMGATSLFYNLRRSAPPDSTVHFVDLQAWFSEAPLSELVLRRLREGGLLEAVSDHMPVEPESTEEITNFLIEEFRGSGKRLVLALDETVVLLHREFLQWRTVFDLFQILSDSGVLVTVTHFERLDQIKQLKKMHRFFERCKVQFLGALDKVSARERIVEWGNYTGIGYTSEALAFISEMTGNWPYFMQLLCHTLFNESRALRPSVIPIVLGREDIEVVINQVLEHGEYAFRFLVENAPDEWKSILMALSENNLMLEEIEGSTDLSESKLLEILPELARNSLLEEKNDVYSIKAGLLRRYLAHHLSKEEHYWDEHRLL